MTTPTTATEAQADAYMAEIKAKVAAKRAATPARKPRRTKKERQLELMMAQYERDVAANPNTIIYNPTTDLWDAYRNGECVARAGSYRAAESQRMALVERDLAHTSADSPAEVGELTSEEIEALSDRPLCAVETCPRAAEATCPRCGARVCVHHLGYGGCFECYDPHAATLTPEEAEAVLVATTTVDVHAAQSTYDAAALAHHATPTAKTLATRDAAYLVYQRALAAADPQRARDAYTAMVERGNTGPIFNPATGEMEVVASTASCWTCVAFPCYEGSCPACCPPALTTDEARDVEAEGNPVGCDGCGYSGWVAGGIPADEHTPFPCPDCNPAGLRLADDELRAVAARLIARIEDEAQVVGVVMAGLLVWVVDCICLRTLYQIQDAMSSLLDTKL